MDTYFANIHDFSVSFPKQPSHIFWSCGAKIKISGIICFIFYIHSIKAKNACYHPLNELSSNYKW